MLDDIPFLSNQMLTFIYLALSGGEEEAKSTVFCCCEEKGGRKDRKEDGCSGKRSGMGGKVGRVTTDRGRTESRNGLRNPSGTAI